MRCACKCCIWYSLVTQVHRRKVGGACVVSCVCMKRSDRMWIESIACNAVCMSAVFLCHCGCVLLCAHAFIPEIYADADASDRLRQHRCVQAFVFFICISVIRETQYSAVILQFAVYCVQSLHTKYTKYDYSFTQFNWIYSCALMIEHIFCLFANWNRSTK